MSSHPVLSVDRLILLAGALVAALLSLAEPVRAQDTAPGNTVRIDGTGDTVRAAGASVEVTGTAKTIWAAGATVDIDATATRGVWAAGADVSVDGAVGKSVHAFGSRVIIDGVAGGRLWVAGGDVSAEITTGSDVYAAGGHVRLGPATNIGGSLSIAAGDVVVAGRTRGDARIAAGSITLDGQIDGTVTVAAERVILGPRAAIGGDLVLMPGTETEIAATAAIGGETRSPGFGSWRFERGTPFAGGRILWALFMFGIATATGLGLMVLMRGTYAEAVRRARNSPVSSFLIGVLLLVLVPIVAVLVGLTVVGLPLALILVLSLVILMVIANAVAALAIADTFLSRGDAQLGVLSMVILLLIGALIFAAVGMIPYAGSILVLLLLVIGCGAFGRVAWRRLRRPFIVESTHA